MTTIPLSNFNDRVDYAIVTIRPDEFSAVLDRVPNRITIKGDKQLYEFAKLSVNGGTRGVAVVKCQSQGQLIAQSVTSQLIRDISPRVILLVGIAGGVPSDDFSLGDVILASHLHNFCVTAANQGGHSELNISGGPLHKTVDKLVSHLPALLDRIPHWNSSESLRTTTPKLTLPKDLSSKQLYGSQAWKRKVFSSLKRHFPVATKCRLPKAHAGPTASSNQLVKDAELLSQWLKAARSLTNIEMELAGVVQAARDADGGEIPVIAIRGLSDIVGFRRDDAWTTYACHTAASLCISMISAKLIEEATPFDWDSPLVEGKVHAVLEWMGSASRDPDLAASKRTVTSSGTSPRDKILVIGAGGVGKSTLGAFLDGSELRSPLALPSPYNESSSIESYSLEMDRGRQAMLIVAPGQEHRRISTKDEVYAGVAAGEFRGVISYTAYGYHSLGQIRWKEHEFTKRLKRKNASAFLREYLVRQREEEIIVLNEIRPHITQCKRPLWIATLVGKEDLWYGDSRLVRDHYLKGNYSRVIRNIQRARGSGRFRHELVLSSLVISNFTSSIGETLAHNREGYDRAMQVASLRQFIEVLDALRDWENTHASNS